MVTTTKRGTARRPHSPRSAWQARSRVRHLSIEDGRKILDREARAYFGISGEEFSRLYRSGALNGDSSKVSTLGMIVSVVDAD